MPVAEWFRSLHDKTGINFSVFYDRFDGLLFLKGIVTTVELSLACIVLSMAIGAVAAWLQSSRFAPIRLLVAAYVQLFRNTPPLVQLYFFYFGIGTLMPRLAGGEPMFGNFSWTIISLSLFTGAFNTEVFRAGIEAVPASLIDAADALGYPRYLTYIHIVLPLAFRISLPALNNNIVTLVKGTTIAYAIGVPEMLTASATIWATAANVPEMMNLLMLTFLALLALFSAVMRWCERALHVPGYGR